MKILQVVPSRDNKEKLKSLLVQKERKLRGKGTFIRQRAGRWRHVKHPGWITWQETSGGILLAEIHSRAAGTEWQLLQALIGFLDRYFADQIEHVTILYR
ncbi:MAG: hypothetical protein N3B01_00200 [Verrucomicrobiae bacterium]|nr:hypothetical protein [Verrucomicrobiae bacterium]